MSLWRRAPREVYRVYGEDQYLEGDTAPEGETAAREDARSVEPDSRDAASFAAEVPPASPGTAGSSSARPSGSHAGRLIGVGLLVGVGFATLVLVLLNISHRHGPTPEPLAQEARAAVEQRVDRASEANRTAAIGRSRPQMPRFSASPMATPVRSTGPMPKREAPSARYSSLVPRFKRTWSAAVRSPSDGAPMRIAVESPAPAPVGPPEPEAIEPPAQDEFGFEQ
jgi:hypothetical protein